MSGGKEGLVQETCEVINHNCVSRVKRIICLLVHVADGPMLKRLARDGIRGNQFEAPEPLDVVNTDAFTFLCDHTGRPGSVALQVNRPADNGAYGKREKE